MLTALLRTVFDCAKITVPADGECVQSWIRSSFVPGSHSRRCTRSAVWLKDSHLGRPAEAVSGSKTCMLLWSSCMHPVHREAPQGRERGYKLLHARLQRTQTRRQVCYMILACVILPHKDFEHNSTKFGGATFAQPRRGINTYQCVYIYIHICTTIQQV